MVSTKKPAPVPSKRLFARFEKAWIETLPERDRIILGVCRMFPNGFGTDGAERLELAGFDPEDPRGQEILDTFARWSALPAQEALWTGVCLGEALGGHSRTCEVSARSGNHDGAGKLKGAFPLFVLELARLGVPLQAEVIEAFFGTAEEGLALEGRDLTPAHHGALGLLLKANAAAGKPLATNDQSIGLDETGPEPVIRYRLEGDSKPRTCTDHNLRTRVIPAVLRALPHK